MEQAFQLSEIKSPCLKVCVLDTGNVCKGCYRTRTEIATWISMSPEQRDEIMHDLPNRKMNSTS